MKKKEKCADKIIIKGARFYAKIGVSEKERKSTQVLLIDLEILTNFKKSAETDDIKDTINYSSVYDFVENIISGNEFRLLEALAVKISKQIFENFKAEKLTIKIIRPNALKGKADSCGVEITRAR